MAKENALVVFNNEDRGFAFHVKDHDDETIAIDATGWALSFMVKRRLGDVDADALIVKTTAGGSIAVAGTFNASAASNAQRVTVTLLDSDTVSLTPGLCRYELKRTDSGAETVLSFGVFHIRKSVHAS